MKLSLMSNDENRFLPTFQILHINNVLFLLELALALVTSIVMKFAPMCVTMLIKRRIIQVLCLAEKVKYVVVIINITLLGANW